MKVKLKDIAQLIGAQIEGDGEIFIEKASKIEEGTEGSICFLSNEKYVSYLYNSQASAIIVSSEFTPTQKVNTALVRVKDVYSAVSKLLHWYDEQNHEKREDSYIHPMSFIDPTVVLGKGVYVDAFVCIAKNAKIGDHVELQAHTYIGESVQIGKRSKLYSGVKIMHQVQIGEDCIIHANAVIGSDGFGFAPQEDGTYVKVPQLGNVILEDRVEVGAQTVVDRATMGSTLIQSGVKLDNLIQIAHNVVVGKNTVIAAQSGIAGSTKIGENCMIGGQVGIVGHIEIAKGTKIQAQSGINKSIKKENEAFFGSPALLYNDFLKSNAVFKQLPELLKRLDSLEKKLKDL